MAKEISKRRGRKPGPVIDKVWRQATATMPPKPEFTLSDASNEWHRLGNILFEIDRVAAIDRGPLATYCNRWGQFARLMREDLSNEQTQLLIDNPTKQVLHPLVRPLLDSADTILTIAQLFGATARTRELGGAHGNKKPLAIKRLHGNARKVAEHALIDPLAPMLPEWQSAHLDPQDWMNTRAKDEFEKLSTALMNVDLFTPLDLVPVTVLACLADLEQRAYEQLGSTWSPVYNKDGDEVESKANPLYDGIKKIEAIAVKYWKDYGITPQFRQLLNGETRSESDDIPFVFGE